MTERSVRSSDVSDGVIYDIAGKMLLPNIIDRRLRHPCVDGLRWFYSRSFLFIFIAYSVNLKWLARGFFDMDQVTSSQNSVPSRPRTGFTVRHRANYIQYRRKDKRRIITGSYSFYKKNGNETVIVQPDVYPPQASPLRKVYETGRQNKCPGSAVQIAAQNETSGFMTRGPRRHSG